MRKWSKQGFLNPADSNDDGWFKFSIRPYAKSRKILGGSVQYIISDCSNKIYLEFGAETVSVDSDGGVKGSDMTYAKEALAEIKEKRKKVKVWGDAVAQSVDQINDYLDQYEIDLLGALDIAEHRE